MVPVLAVFLLILFSRPLEAGGEKGKVLVFGFESGVINDIQNRLLRERVLWKFRKREYPIVPVMEYERVFREKPESYTRTLNRDVLKRYCIRFRADYAVSGSLESKSFNKSIKEIRAKIRYTCRLILYKRAEDDFIFIKFDIDGDTDYFRFFEELSGKIVAGCERAMEKQVYSFLSVINLFTRKSA